MGVVYEATQLALGRRVAVKVISPQLAHDPEFRERFTREARVAASVHHPNIVDVYDTGEQDEVLYLVMRYVDGTDLRTLLRGGVRLDPARAVAITEPGRRGARRRARRRADPPRRDAVEHPAQRRRRRRAGRADRLRARQAPRHRGRDAQRRRGSGRSRSSRPRRCATTPSTGAPTSTRSAACCTGCSPAASRSTARATPPRSPRTCTTRRRARRRRRACRPRSTP